MWAFGRLPLAISARCYHARIHGLAKDSCQFVCGQDPDGLPVDTLDGERFLAVNGVQTMSHTYADLVGDLDALARAGIRSLRLSPHTGDFVAVCKAFADVASGAMSGAEGLARLKAVAPEAEFSNGFCSALCRARNWRPPDLSWTALALRDARQRGLQGEGYFLQI